MWTALLIILGIILIGIISVAGKALLMVLEFALDLLNGLFSSGCFWILLAVIVLLIILI